MTKKNRHTRKRPPRPRGPRPGTPLSGTRLSGTRLSGTPLSGTPLSGSPGPKAPTPLRAAHPAESPTPFDPDPGGFEMLIGLVTTGALDDYLAQLTNAIDRRQREIYRARSVRALGEFRVGDRVRVNRRIRPLYLQDATGTVTGWAGQRVLVHLDESAGRGGVRDIRVPPLGLDPLSRLTA